LEQGTAGSGSNTLRAVLNELGWSYSRLAAELRRHASVALPKTEALTLAMEVSVLEAKRLGHRAVLQIWRSVSVSRSIRSPEDATAADARVLPMSKKATAPAEFVQWISPVWLLVDDGVLEEGARGLAVGDAGAGGG
jgi:hypothetical protein